MIQPGDLHLADLNEARRRQVLVVSTASFHRLAGRALVAPQLFGEPDAVPFPWRVTVEGAVFAVDFLRSVPIARLLERTGRAPYEAMGAVRRALANIV